MGGTGDYKNVVTIQFIFLFHSPRNADFILSVKWF